MGSRAGQLALLAVGVVVVGCGSESQPPLSPPTVSLPSKPYDPKVDAGWTYQDPNPLLVVELKKKTSGNHGQSFAMRNDPFALLAEEKSFEASQSSERVLAEAGPWRFDYEEPVDTNPEPVFEQQPYRRLAGVIVGESVLAIIDMGEGRPPEIIRPGQRIPNSEWTVVSIDEDKAILRRTGNKLPKEIVVRLESPPAGLGGGGSANPGGGPGGNPGGFGNPRGGAPGNGSGGGVSD